MLQRLIDTHRGPAPARTSNLDAQALARDLRRSIAGEVRFDAGSRALYATDASNYRQVPIGVVIPQSIDDVLRTVELCRRHDVPLLSRGGGTSLCGQCCNVAVVIDFSKHLNRVIEIDPQRKLARVEPGCVLDDLRDAAERFHLTFAPDPSTHNHNTLGGMIGNNSCGVHSVMGGETVDNVIELDVLTYDGTRMTLGATDDAQFGRVVSSGGRQAEIYERLRALRERHADEIRRRFPDIPRRVSGYNLPALLPEDGFHLARAVVGSEGTCVVVLGATLRLVDSPPARSLLVLGYEDVYAAGDHVPDILEFGPVGLEGIDDRLVQDMKSIHLHPQNLKLLPDGGGWLLVEFGGATKDESDGKARRCMDALRGKTDAPAMKLYDNEADEKIIWKVRESGLGATAHVPNKKITWEGWEDSSVPVERLGDYLRQLRALFERYDYGCDLYGHFGQGCVHTRIDFDLETAPGIAKFRAFLHDAAQLVVRLGGSISGEHGDGQSKAELLPIMFGDELMHAFREFKSIWDPQGRMNPGKIVDAYRADENLRLGTSFDPPRYETRFHYGGDGGDFSRALLRCVGVGECRKKHGGVMCPSYMATGEEMHSTRGRARLLFEMMKGEVIAGGWHEDAVHEALELCLSCKGCKGECPVKVDMPTYKAEFYAHYYAHRPKPRAAYLFGLVDRWAKWGARAPRLANFLTQTPALAHLAKVIGHIAHQRDLPALGHEPFTAWHAKQARRSARTRVILWPDTFNNYFYPQTARAAARVLAHLECEVVVPQGHICCGRPLYEFGMVDRARDYLRDVLDRLADDIRAGTPVIGLEPACVSVFRDELTNLFPFDEQAKRLSAQTFLLSEFILGERPDFAWPEFAHAALFHPHCHHRAVLKADAAEKLLREVGLDLQTPDTGCCGMAGSFGFQREKYDVSMACAERALLPAVRATDDETLLIASGFSCREQIRQCTGRETLHPAEVLQMALAHG